MLRLQNAKMGKGLLLWAAAASLAGPHACMLDDALDEQAPASEEVYCTLIGCGPAFALDTEIEVSFDSLHSAALRVCRNGDCRAGAFQDTGDNRQVSASLEASSEEGPGAAQILVFATRTDRPEVCELSVAWFSWDWAERIEAGPDEYEVAIEADGKTLYATHKTVTEYAVSQPNGPKCGPTCSSARFTAP